MKCQAVIFSCLMLAVATQSVHAAAPPALPADPVADIEMQYQAALVALKKPGVTGILVTEVEPESAAANAGIRAGDILTEYYGARMTTLRGLREQVAEAVARHLEDSTAGKRVLARVRRGNEERVLQLPREPLGIRAVEVEAGVPGPRNVPPNPRGMLELNWKLVLATISAEQDPAPFRILQHVELGDNDVPGNAQSAQEEWVGWQLCTLTNEGAGALAGKVDIFRLDTITPPKNEHDIPTEHAAFSFHLQLGDYKTAPAFVLDQLTARYAATSGQEGAQVVATSKRVGEKLQTTVTLTKGEGQGDSPLEVAEHRENTVPLNTIPQAALPWVAAAMPHDVDASLGLYLLSVRDFLPRPGYVLATRGKQAIPADPNMLPPSAGTPAEPVTPANTAWRVDLMHVGVVIESYWFSDQCRLLCIQTQGMQPLIARRVDSAKTASTPQERKPAFRPATRPASSAPSGAL